MIDRAEQRALWMNVEGRGGSLWMNRRHIHVNALNMCAFIGFIAFVFVFSAIPVSAHLPASAYNNQAESIHQYCGKRRRDYFC